MPHHRRAADPLGGRPHPALKKTNILLVDDHVLVRHGIRLLIESEPDFAIAGECGDGLEALRLVDQLHPDVVVADLTMPGLNGLELARQIRQRHPETRVVILSMHSNEAYVQTALQNGASAYVLKQASANDLGRAIHEACAGRLFLSPPLTDLAVKAMLQQRKGHRPSRYDSLTNRERQVLHLVVQGLTSAEIGKRLFTSPRTVETHRANLMKKLQLKTQADLIRFALDHDLVPGDSTPSAETPS